MEFDPGLEASLGEWRKRPGPLWDRLAAALVEAIDRGDLPAGTRLPPERLLSTMLSISRTTVVGAYDRLRDDGRLQSRQGSGTFVPGNPPASGARPTGLTARAIATNAIFDALIEPPRGTIDFSAAAPGAAAVVEPAIRAAVMHDLAPLTSNPGYFTAGLPALRQAIAAYLDRVGLPTAEDEVLITSGSQQAIALVATLVGGTGETVLVENPTYPGALDAFRAAGARLRPVRVTESGVQPDELRQTLARHPARLVYLTPTFNNPTGSVIPAEQRREIAGLAGEFQVPIVEDGALMDISLTDDPPPPPIASFPNDGQVIAVGSLSKLFWGGLRIGWLRAPQPVIDRLAHLKAIADLASPIISQLAAVRLLPQVDAVRIRRRDQLRASLDELTRLLGETLPAWTWRRPLGGVSLWVRLPHGDAADFARIALAQGVAAVPGHYFAADDSANQHLRIAFAGDPARLEPGVRRLARAWQAYQSSTPAARPVQRAIV